MDLRLPVTALLLAGGKSSRMGRDKTRLSLGNRTLLEHMSRKLADFCEEIIVCTGASEAGEPMGLLCVPDLHPGIGPLAGLEAGLRAAHHEWAFLVGCDMPHFSSPLLRFLWEEERMENVEAVLPMGPGGAEPLHALYSRRALARIERALAQGRFGLTQIFEGEGVRTLAWEQISRFSPDASCFRNWNRPEDLPEPLRVDLVQGNS